MIEPGRHDSIQGLLREAFEHHADRLCLIEANRDRENARLSYRDVRAAVLPLAAWLQREGARRVAILMTNQSRWHVAAAATFWIGGELIPLDPKLSPPEHAALLRHSGADTLVIEHHLWRRLEWVGRVIVSEAPDTMDLRGALRFSACRVDAEPEFVARGRTDAATTVYSSGTGGRPKGCVLTHGNYLAQCDTLTRLHRFEPGDRYLSVLPTNHAIDFMVGFLGPYACGATVVHLRTLRPEFVREAFPRYGIAYMALVPMVLDNLRAGLQARFDAQPAPRRAVFRGLRALNRLLTRRRPNLAVSRLLLRPVHRAFGGKLRALFTGGAFTRPDTIGFFGSLGIPVLNGYGLTEAGTAVTLNRIDDNRPDTVGPPLPGTEVRILDPDADGIGEVLVRGPTVMAGYRDEPELTAETIVDGWLHTGDLGRLDVTGHLRLFGRRKNMIVTAGGKNVYPEDVEFAFQGMPAAEYCVFAEHVLWPGVGERLVIVVRPAEDGRPWLEELVRRNRTLPDYKRVHACLEWTAEFPRTASLKIKRQALAEALREADPSRLVEVP